MQMRVLAQIRTTLQMKFPARISHYSGLGCISIFWGGFASRHQPVLYYNAQFSSRKQFIRFTNVNIFICYIKSNMLQISLM